MEEKDILEQAVSLFIRFGIKSMTMDEIARQMGISKKTLYQFVSNKNELVYKSVEMKINEEQDCLHGLRESDNNPIDELMEMTKFVKANMKEIHPSVIFDMKKYHPDAWKLMNDHKERFIYESIKCNLERGVEAGLYRDNMHAEIVARLYLAMVTQIMEFSGEFETVFTQADIYEQLVRYHIRGIANEKGRKYLKEKFKNNNI